jgi:hypothetical protein
MLGNLSGRPKGARSSKWSSELILLRGLGAGEEKNALAAAEVAVAREVDFCGRGLGEEGAGGFDFVPTNGGSFVTTEQSRQLLLEPKEELTPLKGEGEGS